MRGLSGPSHTHARKILLPRGDTMGKEKDEENKYPKGHKQKNNCNSNFSYYISNAFISFS